MSETHRDSVLADVSNALVSLHKEQFGRGPTRAHSHFAGPDILVTVFEGALLPAEKALVEIGEPMRVLEAPRVLSGGDPRSLYRDDRGNR
jgi:uncharacterized protein YbcI